MDSITSDWSSSDGTGVDVLGDANTGYIVNVVRERDEMAVRIPASISAKLKTHQVSFLFLHYMCFLQLIWLNCVSWILDGAD